MTRERPNAANGRGGRRLRHLALALLGSACLLAPVAAGAQDAEDGSGDAQETPAPALTGRASRPGSSSPSSSFPGPSLRGSGGDRAPGLPVPSTAPSEEGDESVSRLPRFRSDASSTEALPPPAAAVRAPPPPTLRQQRAAPPRRFGSATRAITQLRTQRILTDERLTPVIQNPVSGVPLPTSLPALGLLNPASFLLGTALRRPLAVDQAYLPLGIRLGTFTVLPAFTQSIGFDSNPDQIGAQLTRSSMALRSEVDLAVASDWSSSAFTGELRAAYLEYPSNPEASRPTAAGASRLRIDVSRETRLELETRLVVDTQRAGSPDLNSASTVRPLFATYGLTAGIFQTFNRFQLSLRGTIDRQIFEDAQLGNGTTLIQSDRDANLYGVRLRAGYEISPTIVPFVETILDTRVYDRTFDQFGLRRNSDGIAFTAGATVQIASTLAGEVSAGMQHRSYVDPSLRDINAPLVNAILTWSVSPLTTVRFNQQTGVVETAVVGSSGTLTDVATLEVQHDLLRNLSITLGGAYLSFDYEGVQLRERGFSATARLDYRFNRWLTMRGSYVYSQIGSSQPISAYEAHTVLLGLRVNP